MKPTATLGFDSPSAAPVESRATGTPLPMAHVTAELYRLLEAQGHREVDQIGLIRLYAEGPLRAKSG